MRRIPLIGEDGAGGPITGPNLVAAYYAVNNAVTPALPASLSLPAGVYEFVLSGGGGALSGGDSGAPWMGGAGGLCISTRQIAATDTLTTTTTKTTSGNDVTLTLPDGTTMSAKGGSGGSVGATNQNPPSGNYVGGYDGAGGVASGGDINVSANGRNVPTSGALSSTGIPTRQPIGGGPASLLIYKVG